MENSKQSVDTSRHETIKNLMFSKFMSQNGHGSRRGHGEGAQHRRQQTGVDRKISDTLSDDAIHQDCQAPFSCVNTR